VGKSFSIQAASAEERDAWFAAIQKAIDGIENQLTTKAVSAPMNAVAPIAEKSKGALSRLLGVSKTNM